MDGRKITQQMNSLIVSHTGIGLFRYNLDKEKFDFANRALKASLKRCSQKNITKLKFKDIFSDKKDADSILAQLRRNKSIKFYKVRLRRKSKGYLWAAITASLIKCKTDHKKRTSCIEGIIEDINSQVEMENKLTFEKNMLENLLDNIPDAIYFKDRNNRLTKVNKFYARGFKMQKQELIGKTDFSFFPPNQARKMSEDDNYVLKTGKPIIGKIERTLLPNKTWNQVVTTKIPLYDEGEKIIGTMGITRDITAFSNLEEEKLEMSTNAIRVLSKIHQLRDPYTSDHSNRVSIMAGKIAQELGWSDRDILGIKIVGQLHDIGKITVPAEILSKPGKLSSAEYMLIQQHVQNCYNIVKDFKYPFPLAEAIYQHHERLNGLGYPRKLKKVKIIPAAKILAICDVLEAMTYRRPYREALGLKAGLKELKSGSGKRYDPGIVKIVFKLIKENKGQPFWPD